MKRELYDSFSTLLDDYHDENLEGFNKLTEDDKKWCSLYYFVSYYKSKT